MHLYLLHVCVMIRKIKYTYTYTYNVLPSSSFYNVLPLFKLIFLFSQWTPSFQNYLPLFTMNSLFSNWSCSFHYELPLFKLVLLFSQWTPFFPNNNPFCKINNLLFSKWTLPLQFEHFFRQWTPLFYRNKLSLQNKPPFWIMNTRFTEITPLPFPNVHPDYKINTHSDIGFLSLMGFKLKLSE